MATQVFKVETFNLQDEDGKKGKEMRIMPLPIKALREFMKMFEGMQKAKTEMDAMEKMYEIASFVIQKRNPDITEEDLEEGLDMPTMVKIIEIGGGVNLDPNQ